MPGARRDSVAFTVVVTAMVLSRRAPDPARHRPLGGPGFAGPRDRAGGRCRSARWSAATCGWTATSRSRRRCSRSGCCGAASSRPRRALLLQGIGGFVVGFTDNAEPGGRRAGHRGGQQGALPAAAALVAPRRARRRSSTASSTPAWSASASPSPRTSSTSPRPTTAPTAPGPGGTEALTGTFVLRCLFSPFAHPLFTAFTGIGVGIAVVARSARRARPGAAGRLRLAVAAHAIWNTSTVFGFDSFVGVYLLLMAPGVRRAGRLAVWAAPVRAPDARPRALQRRRRPRADPRHRHRLGRRPRRPSREAARYAREHGGSAGPSGRCATTSRPRSSSASCTTATCAARPPPDFAARGQELRRAHQAPSAPRSRSPDRWYPPDDRLSRRGCRPTAPDADRAGAAAQRRSRRPAAARAPRRRPSSAPPGPRWSTSSRTTSSRG